MQSTTGTALSVAAARGSNIVGGKAVGLSEWHQSVLQAPRLRNEGWKKASGSDCREKQCLAAAMLTHGPIALP